MNVNTSLSMFWHSPLQRAFELIIAGMAISQINDQVCDDARFRRSFELFHMSHRGSSVVCVDDE